MNNASAGDASRNQFSRRYSPTGDGDALSVGEDEHSQYHGRQLTFALEHQIPLEALAWNHKEPHGLHNRIFVRVEQAELMLEDREALSH
jgi:hypothetical protein